ncbi:unnamed protein product [Rotaria sp. Silwood1]|nr:unnamed protein product [Rotaria sp. Silwood1]CAF3612542.1 unnamed protein product [Rotaria sp. Silwood1]CAF3619310.1 unnamed protein product [Rotaria sp. Silwood1]CAF3649776.1 unnamed protein product [Rotaria sp. Silwood1]CAF4865182.1 unnamed protein product [Rotaria sp. Silwood1]
MGCTIHKSSKTLLKKEDLIELQKYPEELHEKHIKILQWMENDLELKTQLNDYNKINWKKIKDNEQLSYWQEAWQREQELVKHPSMVDSCESKMPCITLIDENLRVLCDENVDTFWRDFEKPDVSN